MAKFAILDLDGDLQQQGFRATLEISSNTARHLRKVKGNLPPAPELASYLHCHWLEKYRNLGSPARLEGQKIIRKGSINQRREECKQSAQALRDRLIAWLASESFRDIDRRLREEFDRNDAIALLLRTEDPDLQKLPWGE